MARNGGIPDMRYINRQVPIVKVARELDLRVEGASKIHCWHPDRHQHGDRTASVGIRTRNNTVKCFGCDSKPLTPIDFVMDVLGLSAADAALWIAEHFDVPTIPKGKRLTEEPRFRSQAGCERGLGLLVRCGLFGTLSESARSLAVVFAEMCDKDEPMAYEFPVQISYGGITRYSGVVSSNAIRKALLALGEIGFLQLPEAGRRRSPQNPAATYIVTPNSNELNELAQAQAAQMRTEIAAERELRRRLRTEKTRAWREKSGRQVSTVLGGGRGSIAAPSPAPLSPLCACQDFAERKSPPPLDSTK